MKITSFLPKNRKTWIITAVLALVVVVIVLISTRSSGISAKTITVKYGDVEQTVSATGRVVPTENVDLAFERSGKVVYIGIRSGETVKTGRILVTLDLGDLKAQEMQSQANVDAAQIRLDQAIKAESINTAGIGLENAQKNLDDVINGKSPASAKIVLNTVINSLVSLDEVLAKYPTERNNADIFNITNDKELALQIICGQPNLGSVQPWYYLALNGGLKQQLSDTQPSFSASEIKNIFNDLKKTISYVQDMAGSEYSMLSAKTTDADKASVTAVKNNLAAQAQAIENQEQEILSAENALSNAAAQSQLNKSADQNYEVEIARAQLASTQAGLAQVRATIAKNIIVAPFSGVVARLDAKVGEIISPSQSAVSLISDKKFQIETNIPEADIAKIKVGNISNVTVDAYGQDISWNAHVVNIDPGEKIIDGVSTYKTTLVFDTADNRIRSGMTANLDIVNAIKKNVLFIPQRVVIRDGGERFADLLLPRPDDLKQSRYANLTVVSEKKNEVIVKMPIELGLQGSDGKVEVISGLKEGDLVISE